MKNVIPEDLIPGKKLTGEQRIRVQDAVADLLNNSSSEEEVNATLLALATEMLNEKSQPQRMEDEQLLDYAAKLLRHIKADMPGINDSDLLAVLSLAALGAQGAGAMSTLILKSPLNRL